jgi:hypothetical protein
MFKKRETDPFGRFLSAGVGATLATSYAAIKGQPPQVCLLVLASAIVLTLVLDELGIV